MSWFRIFFVGILFAAVNLQAQERRVLEIFPRHEIDLTLLGINAFANDSRFGTPQEQFSEISSTLGIKYIRVLFAWSDQVQPTPGAPIDFSFYDDIVKALPRGTKALVVIANMPSWMNDDSNWTSNNARTTYFKFWVKKVVTRYRRKRKVLGFQVFNEPNSEAFFENYVMSTVNSPRNYLELLKRSSRFIKRRAKKKKVVGAATSSIIQNFPETLNYNQTLRDAGIESLVDVFSIHVYGSSLERYYLGIGDFLASLARPIWVTESGQQGVLEQLEYVERVWPFLKGEHPAIERFFYYRYADSPDIDSAYGLKNLSLTNPVSDLYVYAR
ncbi:MAG: cellulase family glycosylhydrolase, partial [Bdellovibrionales bacterium]|nr:cellulase family glycosylhydrolase [Bdellovibrionales bacterium]